VKKVLLVLSVLVVVQGVFLLFWLGIVRFRGPEVPGVEHLTAPAPDLALLASDGSERRLSELRGSTVVLHFWATWCPPCREELPSLLAYGASAEVELLAVSVDPQWEAVRDFVGNGPLEPVYLASADAVSAAFGLEELPQTFVIDPAGNLCLHLRDARDWGTSKIRELVAGCRDR